ncbi:M20/M25/M40 family metallo-hydrolase [Krasilnikovia sp. MM14-A1259]|uniref:M20/M25/M40 family metallo-hydrolase n=1 Tax=Krasilnikovia sp. MM14-A1259 TaxID=3373539 RepID=UPI00381B352A
MGEGDPIATPGARVPAVARMSPPEAGRRVAVRSLRDRVQRLRAHALSRLETLVMAESPSDDPALLGVVVRELADAYATSGARVERDQGPDADHLVCHWPGRSPDADGHVLLIGHCDTVFPRGTAGRRPFRIAADGDTATGPGVYDMKGALVAVEVAMLLLAEAGVPLRRAVRLVIVNDEEIGSPDGQRVVATHADGAVAALGLEPSLPGGGLKVGRRGVARVEVRVAGREAHAGVDAEQGVSAIDELIDHLITLRLLGPAIAVNVGTVAGGTRANVVAGHARAEIGLRFATAEAERSAWAAVESLTAVRAGAVVRTRTLSHRPVWTADPANPLAVMLVDLAAGMGLRIATGPALGAADTNLTGAQGIPTVDGLGPDGGGAHAAREHMSIRSMLDRAALLAACLS